MYFTIFVFWEMYEKNNEEVVKLKIIIFFKNNSHHIYDFEVSKRKGDSVGGRGHR